MELERTTSRTAKFTRQLLNLVDVYRTSSVSKDEMEKIITDFIEAFEAPKGRGESEDFERMVKDWADLKFCRLSQSPQHRAFCAGALRMADFLAVKIGNLEKAFQG